MKRFPLILFLLLFAAGCGSNSLTGKWSLTMVDPQYPANVMGGITLTLNSSGTCHLERMRGRGELLEIDGTWEFNEEEKELKIKYVEFGKEQTLHFTNVHIDAGRVTMLRDKTINAELIRIGE